MGDARTTKLDDLDLKPHRVFGYWFDFGNNWYHQVQVERIEKSVLDELVVTDTIPLREDALNCKRIRQLSIAALLAETMLRISNEDSVSSLFME